MILLVCYWWWCGYGGDGGNSVSGISYKIGSDNHLFKVGENSAIGNSSTLSTRIHNTI